MKGIQNFRNTNFLAASTHFSSLLPASARSGFAEYVEKVQLNRGENKITAFCIQNDLIEAYALGAEGRVGRRGTGKVEGRCACNDNKKRKGRIKLWTGFSHERANWMPLPWQHKRMPNVAGCCCQLMLLPVAAAAVVAGAELNALSSQLLWIRPHHAAL